MKGEDTEAAGLKAQEVIAERIPRRRDASKSHRLSCPRPIYHADEVALHFG